jgi:hypothetical protein
MGMERGPEVPLESEEKADIEKRISKNQVLPMTKDDID